MPREGLHAKLKRYEELLKSYGAELEPSEDLGSAATSPRDVEMVEDTKRRSKGREDPFGLEVTDPKLVTKDGTSRYFDRYAPTCFPLEIADYSTLSALFGPT